MKLIHLEYFVAVCKLGSTTQAANVLFITQPAISAAIRELEKEFGVLLFTRTGKRLEITDAGQQLYTLALDLLEKAESTRQIMSDIARKRNRVALGITPTLACILLPELYKKFSTLHPDIRFVVREDGRHNLFRQLDERELDMVICSQNRDLDDGYQKLHLMDLEFCLCVSAKHPLAQAEKVPVLALKDEPLAGFTLAYHQNQAIDLLFAQVGLKPKIVFRTSQISTMLELVSHGLLSCFSYTALQQQRQDLRFIPLDPGLGDISINLYWRKGDYLYSDMDKLLQCVKSLKLS